MSITKFTQSLAIMLAVLVLHVSSVQAQRNHEFTPFIDPLEFNPDFQFFAPAELGDFGKPPPPKTGWFAAYNRMYIYVTRPELEESATSGDFGWGNRYDIGYMTDDNSGWWFSGIRINGPNKYDVLRHPMINRFNEDDSDQADDNGDDDEVTIPVGVFPIQDRNNILSGARDVDLHTSLNVASLSGFELNKAWRLEPLHHGGILEPFVGFRYMKFRDFTRRDLYNRFDEFGLMNPFPNEDDVIEQLTLNRAEWINHMVGGQVGIRWSERKSRWLLSSELRAFAAQNFQDFIGQTDTLQTLYDGVGTGSEVIAEKYERQTTRGNDENFVYGFDVRAESAFELTRDVSLTMGAQFMHFAQGVGRGSILSFSSEDLTMVGFTFGVQVNR
jgi:hypothetical protein